MDMIIIWSVISLLILFPTDVPASEPEVGTSTAVFSGEIPVITTAGPPVDTTFLPEQSSVSSSLVNISTPLLNETLLEHSLENTSESIRTTTTTPLLTETTPATSTLSSLHGNLTTTTTSPTNSFENQTTTSKPTSTTLPLPESTVVTSATVTTTVPISSTAEKTTTGIPRNQTDAFDNNTTTAENEALPTVTSSTTTLTAERSTVPPAPSIATVEQQVTTTISSQNVTVTSSLTGNVTESHPENTTFIPISTTKAATTNPEELMESFTSSTASANGTLERRSTYVSHMCVTSETCNDPNSHCVNSAGRNICICRQGFVMNDTIGICVAEPVVLNTDQPEHETTTSSLNETGRSLDDIEDNATRVNSQTIITKREFAILASHLSRQEGLGVVSIALQPATSVVQWILENDGKFRKALADIMTATNFSVKGDGGSSVAVTATVLPEHIIYVAPSPQMSTDGILISFVIEDHDGVTSHLSQYSTISRHRRDISSITAYFPAVWIVRAIRASQRHLEEMLNQTISWLVDGPSTQLFTSEVLASASLFERRLDVFVPLILVAAICCLALALGLACVRAKARSSATWDPPAGVVYGKTTLKREDPLGSATRTAPGCDLASDEQCREGEDHKNNIVSCDEDVWVVPYDDDNNQNNRLKTQFEDTKL